MGRKFPTPTHPHKHKTRNQRKKAIRRQIYRRWLLLLFITDWLAISGTAALYLRILGFLPGVAQIWLGVRGASFSQVEVGELFFYVIDSEKVDSEICFLIGYFYVFLKKIFYFQLSFAIKRIDIFWHFSLKFQDISSDERIQIFIEIH